MCTGEPLSSSTSLYLLLDTPTHVRIPFAAGSVKAENRVVQEVRTSPASRTDPLKDTVEQSCMATLHVTHNKSQEQATTAH